MKKYIAVLAGDGIGPEIMKEGLKVLDVLAKKKKKKKYTKWFFFFVWGVGGDQKWENLQAELTPERGALLPLRAIYGLFANLRPAVIFGPLADAASLKSERL